MLSESSLSFFVVIVELNFGINSSLFPESRNRPSNLQMRKTVVVDENKLLCFTKVGDMTFVIDTSVIVTSSAFFP